jgi:hypothetical protein
MAEIRWHVYRYTSCYEVLGDVLHPEVLEEIAVTGNGYGNAVSCGWVAIDCLDNRLSGEVGVAAVNALEKGDLGLTG